MGNCVFEKIFNKGFLSLIIISIFGVILTGCNKKIEQPVSQNTNEKIKISEKPNIIVLDGCFLGTIEDGKWNSDQKDDSLTTTQIRKLSVNDLEEKKIYYLYNMISKLTETNDFIDSESEKQTDTVYFRFDFRINKNENEKIVNLGMTAEFNPLPKEIDVNVAPAQKHVNAIRKILDENGLIKTQVNINKVVSVDIDNDGLFEEIIIASTPKYEGGSPIIKLSDREKSGCGVYIAAVVLKGETVIPLFYQGNFLKDFKFNSESTIPFGIESCTNLELLGVYDLNNDGKFEICIRDTTWDCPIIRVMEWEASGVFEEVLSGNFGW